MPEAGRTQTRHRARNRKAVLSLRFGCTLSGRTTLNTEQDMQICSARCPGERLSMWKYPLHCLSYSWNSLPQNEPKPEPDGDGYMNDRAYHQMKGDMRGVSQGVISLVL